MSQDNKPSADNKLKKAKEATSFTIGNPSRLIPSQLRFISLQPEGQRYVPICRQAAPSGIVMLLDLDPEAPESVERGTYYVTSSAYPSISLSVVSGESVAGSGGRCAPS